MSSATTIALMTQNVAIGRDVIQESRRRIQYLVAQGINAATALRELAQLERAQQSREEMLGLARIFSAIERDPRKG
jgi:uncharacterized protein YoaH (UPF0181 family)